MQISMIRRRGKSVLKKCLGGRTALAMGVGAAALVGPAVSQAAVVLVDFGTTPTTAPDSVGRTWNNFNADLHPTAAVALVDSANAASGISMQVGNGAFAASINGFNGSNNAGTTAPAGAVLAKNWPVTAVSDSGYGNAVGAAFNGATVRGVRVTLGGLDANTNYAFDLFGSRAGVTDVRETAYTITGGTPGTAATTLLLNTSNNTSNLVSAAGFRPDSGGNITIDVTAGPGNTNTANGFFYFGVLEVNTSPVPEPAALASLGAAAVTLLSRRRRA